MDPKGKECAPFRKVDRIIKLSAGANHFLALRQVVVRPSHLWDIDEVVAFFAKIGFPEVDNIIKHSKVRGDQLWPFDEDFMSDTLGISGPNEQ